MRHTVDDVLRYARGLKALAHECHAQSAAWFQIAQARKVNRKRGAWRRPPLAGSVSRLEKLLRAEYARLERQVIAVLAGATLESARADEEAPEFDEAEPVDQRRLAVVLILLGLWRARQLAVMEEAVADAFRIGREQVLKRFKLPDARPQPSTEALSAELLRRYREDAIRFHRDLLDGTTRSVGVRQIVESGGSIGEVMNSIRALFDVEGFRISMWSEAVIWSSWLSGFRAGAVDGTQEMIAAGVTAEKLPQFEWRGPADNRTCQPCLDQFRGPFIARSLADLPEPSSICEFQLACRHWYGLV